MFEKETEEYATRLCCTDCKAIICAEKCECWTFAKKGAEFGYIKGNEQLTKAKELIKEMLSILPKENIEGIYEITEEAEQFIREVAE